MMPLADAIRAAAAAVRPCRICGNLDAADPCCICRDPERERGEICVLGGVADLWAIERARGHRDLYRVLGGTPSALGGVAPEDLAVAPLLARLDGVTEVILALPATVDGAPTAHFLHDPLRPTGVAVTRLALGVPMGGAIDVLDEGTLAAAALKARRQA